MSESENNGRPMTARGYKGPRWLIDLLPRVGNSGTDRDTDNDE